MSELRETVRQERRRFDASPEAYDGVLKRVRRRERTRRFGVASAALTSFLVVAAILWSSFSLPSPWQRLIPGGERSGRRSQEVCESDGVCRVGQEVVVRRLTFAGHRYTLVAYRSNQGLCLEFADGKRRGGGCGFDLEKHYLSVTLGTSSDPAVTDITGITRPEVARVTARLGDGRKIRAKTIAAPSRLGMHVRFYVILVEGNVKVRTLIAPRQPKQRRGARQIPLVTAATNGPP